MLHNVKPFLFNHLRFAVQREAEELRFVSGQQPSIKIEEGLRPCGEITTSADLVLALHEVLLSEMRGGEESSTMDYTVAVPQFGTLWCHFESKGNTKTLLIRRGPTEATLAHQTQRVSPPSLGEGARLDEGERGNARFDPQQQAAALPQTVLIRAPSR